MDQSCAAVQARRRFAYLDDEQQVGALRAALRVVVEGRAQQAEFGLLSTNLPITTTARLAGITVDVLRSWTNIVESPGHRLYSLAVSKEIVPDLSVARSEQANELWRRVLS